MSSDLATPVIGNAGPLPAYRRYLGAIARRDGAAVIDAMTEEYSRPLRELYDTVDFGPIFELWCVSQSDTPRISRCRVDGDRALVEARSSVVMSEIEMRHVGGHWRVSSERHRLVFAATRAA